VFRCTEASEEAILCLKRSHGTHSLVGLGFHSNVYT
jgi:hypothetical protein